MFMKRSNYRALLFGTLAILIAAFFMPPSRAMSPAQSDDDVFASAKLIFPEEAAQFLKTHQNPKPLVIDVGFHVLYEQAHIPGSIYVGPTAKPEGMDAFRHRISREPHSRTIVLYCGCCPWNHCPNIRPAFRVLHDLGFKNVKVIYIPNDFGSDWVNKGLPVEKGE
jgi:Rhodanese-like domain